MPNALGLQHLHYPHRVHLLTCWALFAALLLGACGGGSGASSPPPPLGASSQPPPPAVSGYTVEGTVSGLAGSGLTLEICSGGGGPGGGYYPHPPHLPCHSLLQVSANGAFTLDSVYSYPAGYSGSEYVAITQQPSSPTQRCVISNAAVSIQNATNTGVTVVCADYNDYSYVTNAADNTLSTYRVDATTGALTVVGTPIATGASPYAIVGLDTGGQRFVFVGNEGSNDVSAFVVNSATGALTAVPGSPFAAGTDPKAMALALPWWGGYNLYVANAGSDTVSAYNIDTNTGALTPLSTATIATGEGPASIVINSNLGYVFVANNGGSNDISAFSLSPSGLTPVPGSPFPAGGNPLSLDFGAGGNFLYAANPDATNPSVSGFSIDPATGALSPLSGSPFPLPVSHYMAIEQTGLQTGINLTHGYLYVTTDASIVGYAFDWTTGALTALPGFPVAAGANAYSVNIVGNQFLYVANDGAANISGFTLDLLTGALTPMTGSPFPAGKHPEFITMF
jgi:6-phosphogluconolactonase